MTPGFGTVSAVVTSKRTSTDPDDTRRTPGIVSGLVIGLVLSLLSLFTPIGWAIKVALVSTALLGIAGYAVVHVVHMFDVADDEDDEADDDEADDEVEASGVDTPSSDDKDIAQ
jgi:hypothetical protein